MGIRDTSSRVATFVLLAALVVAARLPFLLIGERFFDSDEAVEGLMARHVLHGEFPALFWGQHYKGVPEVYLMAAVFAVAGSSVLALKASTLAIFVVLVCAQFVLIETTCSRRVAWLASVFTVAVPPVMVQWSMSGNAEFVVVMLAGAVMLQGWRYWRTSGSRLALAVAGFAVGVGLWAQQFILYYVVALMIWEWLQLPDPVRHVREFVRWGSAKQVGDLRRGGWRRWAMALMRLLLAAAAFYLLLGCVAFLGGFSFSVVGVGVSVTHAQKFWRAAVALALLAALVRRVAQGGLTDRLVVVPWLGAVGGFVAGYAPALVHRMVTGRSGPVAGMNIDGLVDALAPMATVMVPILAGYRSSTTAPLGVPVWTAVVPALGLAAAFAAVRRRDQVTVFHVFMVTAPAMFLLSGAYVDLQSYRYLLPIFGAVPALLALGGDAIWQWRRGAGTMVVAAALGVFIWQQVAWYRVIHPDRDAALIMRCMAEADLRYAYSDYWLSYKLTFLSREERIIAQTARPDQLVRYEPYQTLVRAQEPVPTLVAPPPGMDDPSCAEVVQR